VRVEAPNGSPAEDAACRNGQVIDLLKPNICKVEECIGRFFLLPSVSC